MKLKISVISKHHETFADVEIYKDDLLNRDEFIEKHVFPCLDSLLDLIRQDGKTNE